MSRVCMFGILNRLVLVIGEIPNVSLLYFLVEGVKVGPILLVFNGLGVKVTCSSLTSIILLMIYLICKMYFGWPIKCLIILILVQGSNLVSLVSCKIPWTDFLWTTIAWTVRYFVGTAGRLIIGFIYIPN